MFLLNESNPEMTHLSKSGICFSSVYEREREERSSREKTLSARNEIEGEHRGSRRSCSYSGCKYAGLNASVEKLNRGS